MTMTEKPDWKMNKMNVEVKRVVQGWAVLVDGVEEACFDDYEKAVEEAAWIEEGGEE